jgi:hypothetical protein
VNWFVLAAGSFAFLSCEGSRNIFVCYLVSRPYAGSLDSICVMCVFASILLRPLLLNSELFVHPFGLICGLIEFWLLSPQFYVSSFILIYIRGCCRGFPFAHNLLKKIIIRFHDT